MLKRKVCAFSIFSDLYPCTVSAVRGNLNIFNISDGSFLPTAFILVETAFILVDHYILTDLRTLAVSLPLASFIFLAIPRVLYRTQTGHFV